VGGGGGETEESKGRDCGDLRESGGGGGSGENGAEKEGEGDMSLRGLGEEGDVASEGGEGLRLGPVKGRCADAGGEAESTSETGLEAEGGLAVRGFEVSEELGPDKVEGHRGLR
jgi:hypothetical protein